MLGTQLGRAGLLEHVVHHLVHVLGLQVEERLQLQEHIADELLKDDTRALAKMRFQQGAFVSEDRSLVRYLRYVRSFPTNDPSRWLS